MNRYDIKPEGLGEINIDLSDNGDWVRFADIEHLLSNSDYAKCSNCSQEFDIKKCCAEIVKYFDSRAIWKDSEVKELIINMLHILAE